MSEEPLGDGAHTGHRSRWRRIAAFGVSPCRRLAVDVGVGHRVAGQRRAFWVLRDMATETDQTLQRDIAGREAIERILHAAALEGCEHVIDYGGGRGVWSYGFQTATVYDPFPTEWGPPRQGVTFTDSLKGIASADGIIFIGTQQYLSHAQTVEFLDFAREHLEPGGRVLVTIPSVWMVIEWLLRRVRPWHEYPILFWHLANCLRPGYTGAYPTRWPVFVRLARKHGLTHTATLSRDIDREYQRMVGCVNTGRWYHWLVFERKARAA